MSRAGKNHIEDCRADITFAPIMQQTVTPPKIDFSNTQKAFSYKSTSELRRGLWMFQLLNNPILGPIGKKLLKFSIQAGLPIKPFIKATLYKHFVGGEDLQDCLPMVEKLAKGDVKSILDYSDEGKESEAEIESAYNELLHNIKFAAEHKNITFSVFKPTAIASTPLLEKVSSGKTLSGDEGLAWERVKERFDKLCHTAFTHHVPLMVDAEESWIQKAIDDMTLEAMEKYNKEQVVIINTYQMYRKDRLAFLKENFQLAESRGFMIGAKLVRGAYMEKERARAEEKGYPSPIQNTKADTDKDYNEAVRFCIERIDKLFLVVATHNEKSSMLAAELAAEKGISKDFHYLWFSQLLGMCDHISFNLANEGYNVAKYIPYGPVKAVTPYLIRRADENSMVSGQASKEMDFLKEEIKRRKGNN